MKRKNLLSIFAILVLTGTSLFALEPTCGVFEYPLETDNTGSQIVKDNSSLIIEKINLSLNPLMDMMNIISSVDNSTSLEVPTDSIDGQNWAFLDYIKLGMPPVVPVTASKQKGFMPKIDFNYTVVKATDPDVESIDCSNGYSISNIQGNLNINKNVINELKAADRGTPLSVTIDPTGDSELKINNLNLYGNLTFKNTLNKDVYINEIETFNWLNFNMNLEAKNIFMNNITFYKSKINLGASNDIKIENLNVDSQTDITISGNNVYINKFTVSTDNSNNKTTKIVIKANNTVEIGNLTTLRTNNVIIEAPHIIINNYDLSPSNQGIGEVIIKADKIDISALKIDEDEHLTIKPYTKGNSIVFHNNSLFIGTNGELLLSSGDYYLTEFQNRGSTTLTQLTTVDNNQNVNLIVNGDLKLGNNPAINGMISNIKQKISNFFNLVNSLANESNPLEIFGSMKDVLTSIFNNNTRDPLKFKIFVNGSFYSGTGGTFINGLIFAKDKAVLNDGTIIIGAVNAGNEIDLHHSLIIWPKDDLENSKWGICSNTNSNNTSNQTEETSNLKLDAKDINNTANDYTIRTKIAGKAFNLAIVAQNDSLTTPVQVLVSLVDNTTGKIINNTSEKIEVSSNKPTTVSFETDNAYKNVSVEMQNCVYKDENGNIIAVAPLDACLLDNGNYLSCTNNAAANTTTEENQNTEIDENKTCCHCHHHYKYHYKFVNGKFIKVDDNTGNNENKCHHECHHECQHECKHECQHHHNKCKCQDEIDTSTTNTTTETTTGYYCMQKSLSTDNFAIRPDRFKVILDQVSYKKAGEPFNIDVEMLNAKGQVLNIPLDKKDLKLTVKAYEITNQNIKNKMRKELGLSSTDKVDEQVISTAKIDNISNNTISMEYEDAGVIIPIISEKIGNEFAKVDEKDNETKTQLLITPNITIVSKENNQETPIVVRPYKYEIKISNEKYPAWQYMDYADKDGKIQSYIGDTITVIPENKAGKQINNYNRNCFAAQKNAPVINGEKLIVTEPIIIQRKINSSNKNNIIINTIINNENTVTGNIAIDSGEQTLNTIIPTSLILNGKIPTIEEKLTVKKDIKTWQAPSTLKIESVKITSKDNDINSNSVNINKETEFRYGTVFVLPVVTGSNQFSNNVYYEYFNGQSWVINKDYNGNGIITSKSKTPYMTMTAGHVQNGIQVLNFNVNTLGYFDTMVELAIPKYLWTSPLGKEYLDPTDPNSKLYNHPTFEVIHKVNQLGHAIIKNNNIINQTQKIEIDNSPEKAATNKIPQAVKYSY